MRLLPAALDRKQALYLDGMRHAVEIAHLAFHRLCACLANMTSRGEPGNDITSVFADAWTFVDAVDRFRSLYKLFPGFSNACGPPTESAHSFSGQLIAIRELRNVADHIATRIDHVLAKRMPVLGALSWFVLDPDMSGGRICILAPGSIVGKQTVSAVNPAGRKMTVYGGVALVRLSAGEHEVCLAETYENLAIEVRGIEAAIGDQATGMEHAASDALTIITIAFQGPA